MLYNIILLYVLWPVTVSSDVTGMWPHDLITLTLTLSSKNRQIKNKSKRNWKWKWKWKWVKSTAFTPDIEDNVLKCQARFTPGWKSTGWTQRWADLWNDLGFSLCAAPSVCRVVATSDEGEEIRVEVSTDWCVAVEHRRSSSIRDYLRRLSD